MIPHGRVRHLVPLIELGQRVMRDMTRENMGGRNYRAFVIAIRTYVKKER